MARRQHPQAGAQVALLCLCLPARQPAQWWSRSVAKPATQLPSPSRRRSTASLRHLARSATRSRSAALRLAPLKDRAPSLSMAHRQLRPAGALGASSLRYLPEPQPDPSLLRLVGRLATASPLPSRRRSTVCLQLPALSATPSLLPALRLALRKDRAPSLSMEQQQHRRVGALRASLFRCLPEPRLGPLLLRLAD